RSPRPCSTCPSIGGPSSAVSGTPAGCSSADTARCRPGASTSGTRRPRWRPMTSSEPTPIGTDAAPRRPVLLVSGDSLSYYGPKGGLPADHPRIWPNLVAAELGWDVELVARIGWTTRDAWWAMAQDP